MNANHDFSADTNLYRVETDKDFRLYFRGRLVRKSSRPYAAACVTADKSACVSFHHDRGLALKADNGLVIEAVDVTSNPEAVEMLAASEREVKRLIAAQKRFAKKVDAPAGVTVSTTNDDNFLVSLRTDCDPRDPDAYVGGRLKNLVNPKLGALVADDQRTAIKVEGGPEVAQADFERELLAAVAELGAVLAEAAAKVQDWTVPEPFVNAYHNGSANVIKVTVGDRYETVHFFRSGSHDYAREDLKNIFKLLGVRDVLCSSDVDYMLTDHGFDARAELALALDW